MEVKNTPKVVRTIIMLNSYTQYCQQQQQQQQKQLHRDNHYHTHQSYDIRQQINSNGQIIQQQPQQLQQQQQQTAV